MSKTLNLVEIVIGYIKNNIIKPNTVIAILDKINFENEISDENYWKKIFLLKKIIEKLKKLIFEMHLQDQEISDIILFKNINLAHYNKNKYNFF